MTRGRRMGSGCWVYFVQSGASGPVKIGATTGSPDLRVRNLQVGNPEPLTLIAAAHDPDGTLEQECHEWLRGEQLRGEWFRPTPPVFDLAETLDERGLKL